MSMDKELIEALNQLKTITWDGDLINKYKRDLLGEKGLASRTKDGWNFITCEGIDVLVKEDGLWPKQPFLSIDQITDYQWREIAKIIYGESYSEENFINQFQIHGSQH